MVLSVCKYAFIKTHTLSKVVRDLTVPYVEKKNQITRWLIPFIGCGIDEHGAHNL